MNTVSPPSVVVISRNEGAELRRTVILAFGELTGNIWLEEMLR